MQRLHDHDERHVQLGHVHAGHVDLEWGGFHELERLRERRMPVALYTDVLAWHAHVQERLVQVLPGHRLSVIFERATPIACFKRAQERLPADEILSPRS